MSSKVSYKMHFMCLIIGLGIIAIFNKQASLIINSFLLTSYMTKPTIYVTLNLYFYAIMLMIPISILHEVIHGFTYKMFGGKVKFGFKVVFAYTKEVSGIPISRTSFLLVLLAPVTIISLISIAIGGWLGGIIYLTNLLGSTGDFLMVFYLCKYKSTNRIIDRDYGFDIV